MRLPVPEKNPVEEVVHEHSVGIPFPRQLGEQRQPAGVRLLELGLRVLHVRLTPLGPVRQRSGRPVLVTKRWRSRSAATVVEEIEREE